MSEHYDPRWEAFRRGVFLLPTRKRRFGTLHQQVLVYKSIELHALFSSAAVQLTPVLLLPPKPQAWCHCYLYF